ncbi:hypothetical protein Anas_12587 [Armadillidium nasatum]|uniref:Uncharacterized protein n=1 Tax=Armadillidium nasatum TaxID=96803 RepID=A0A5N5TMX0_9CRUS|nr:hypothetical protein Anas_12587 [Armadillidium nasatum]
MSNLQNFSIAPNPLLGLAESNPSPENSNDAQTSEKKTVLDPVLDIVCTLLDTLGLDETAKGLPVVGGLLDGGKIKNGEQNGGVIPGLLR